MSDIYFSNFHLEDDTQYFLYIGELKNYGLNLFLREALSRIFNCKFDFIAVVPDVFEQYNYENIIVINPMEKNLADKYGKNVSCRIKAGQFMDCVSKSLEIKALIKRILNKQEHLYVYMYESLPEMKLDEIPGISILGPDKHIAHRLNSKIYQYNKLKELIPVVDFDICNGLKELINTAEKRIAEWQNGAFISREYSAAGVNSMIAHSVADIMDKFREEDETYLISRYIPHDYDPTILAIVANEEDVYIAGVADQCIEHGTRFVGSTFPSILDEDITTKLKEYTAITGKWLAKQGYKGIFGCDYIVDTDSKIFFLEINARKQGTTQEFCCTLEQTLPHGSPMLPELEFYAVTEGVFPANTVEMESNPKNIHWGTYNYKISHTVQTKGYIPQSSQERLAFKKVADGNLKKDFLILEHTGSDFVVADGAFIGRIVALGHDPKSVRQGLELGIKTLELTIV